MDKNILVAYKSKYGTTRQYAEWIAKALGAEMAESKTLKPEDLRAYDVVVYGGGLYAGGIAGIKLVTRGLCKNLVIFTVGLANPDSTDYGDIINRNIAPELLEKIKLFHFRGGIDYKRLGPVHKVMMAAVKGRAQKNPKSERDAEDKEFLETYGSKVDYLDSQTIEPLVSYVKSLT